MHGVCADYNVDFLRVSDSIGQFGFVVRERLLVTGWRHPLAGIDAVRQAARGGARFASGFAVLAAIIGGFCRVAVRSCAVRRRISTGSRTGCSRCSRRTSATR